MSNDPRTNANLRFVRKPYQKIAYPYDTHYPAYVYPKNTSSLSYDDKMMPYIFRHYIPPTFAELWDYNKKDMIESQYNESLRKEIAKEIYNAPGRARFQKN